MPGFYAQVFALVLSLLPFEHGHAEGGKMDAEQFTSHYVSAFTTALPDTPVKRDGPLRLTVKTATGQVGRVFLENPYSDYCADPDALEDIVQTHVRSIVQSISRYAAEGSGVDLDEVLPMIRARDWIEDRGRQVRRAGGRHGSETFHEPFVGPLVIVYAMDRPDTIQYLRHLDVERLDVEPATLKAKAIENLARRVPDFRAATIRGGNAAVFEADDDLASSLLLFDGIWSREAFQFGGDVVVAVPERGTLLVTGSDNAAGLAHVRDIAAKITNGSPYGLSDILLVRRNGRFELFE